jgi:micrococcal nuclease
VYEYNAEVTNIVDADTFDATVDLGFFIKVKHRFRVRDYDAPETWRPTCNAELEHGKRATEFAKTLLNKPIKIKSYGIGIYGRFSADIILSDGRDFVSVMKEHKFSKLDNYESLFDTINNTEDAYIDGRR